VLPFDFFWIHVLKPHGFLRLGAGQLAPAPFQVTAVVMPPDLVLLQQDVLVRVSIDSLPFISLPKPEQQTVNKLEQDIANVQDSVQEVVLGIQEFRDGISGEIDRVTGLLDEITARITESRQNLEQLNSKLQALQDLAAQIRSKVTLVFNSLSAIITLFLAWVVYTQVETIRTYVQRWKGLEPEPVTALPAEESTDSDSADALDVEMEEADVPNP
jgi:archaellum component FlaC